MDLNRCIHKLQVTREREKNVDVTIKKHRLVSLQLKSVVRWQKHVLWRRRVRATMDGAAAGTVAGGGGPAGSAGVVQRVVLMVSVDHADKLAKLDSSVIPLLDQLVSSAARFEAATVAIRGAGVAADKGYYCILFETPLEAVAFALQLQHAAMRVPWPAAVAASPLCPPLLRTDGPTAASPYAKDVAFYTAHALPAAKGAFTVFDVTKFAGIAEALRQPSQDAAGATANTSASAAAAAASSALTEDHIAYGPRLRMGMHSGTVLQDDGYYGQAIMKASLLCAKARGGELVMSEVVEGAVSEALTEETVFMQVMKVGLEEDPVAYNWREEGRAQDLALFRNNERAWRCYCREHAWRYAMVPEVSDAYLHERVAYNPNWHVRFCNLPPEYWEDPEPDDPCYGEPTPL